jgi:alkanesulfonate monooxygenase SsuD/methylene tetrahydromethanopterin reductase-like flavin-dependent oxidoreductase (luciferase family)
LLVVWLGVTSFAAEDPGTWQPLFDAATVADEAGVDRLVVSDHVVFGERLEEYARPEIGGQAGGKQPTGPDGHWLEPLTTLSVLAGMTSRIRLGTNILVAALRRPAVLAKSTATLDVLSGGRLALGVGSAGSARSTTPPGCRSTGAGACSTTRSRCSRRSGASSAPPTTRPSCASRPRT